MCHRDYLGAALSLGLKRETLGDIWVLEPGAFFFCTPTAAEFILQNLVQVGKSGVTVRRVSLDALPSPPGASIPVRFTVQSPRLDAIVRSLFHISRPDAVKAIASGRVMLNYMPCLRPDMEVHEKDILPSGDMAKRKFRNLEEQLEEAGFPFRRNCTDSRLLPCPSAFRAKKGGGAENTME